MAAAIGLDQQDYYHGLIHRADAGMLLNNQGEFLIRMLEPVEDQPGSRSYILSVKAADRTEQIKHYVVRYSDGEYFIGTHSFATIQALVQFYLTTGMSIVRAYDCFLRTPVGRQSWELNHQDVTVTDTLLGRGVFTEVYLGVWNARNVAIKLAHLDNLKKKEIKEILDKTRLMRTLKCDYVIRLWGVAAANEPLMIVMELASNGALNSYLEKNQLDDNQKAIMCLQASWGIEYLHTKNLIHRDIAARSCLYGDGKVKISRLGMCCEGPVHQMDPKRRVPLRWLAPETMRHQTFTFKTDVYSFGLLAWEIYHNGREPFPHMTAVQVLRYILRGDRMGFHGNVNPEIQLLIGDQWAEDPNARLTQEQISRRLEAITNTPKPEELEGYH